MYVLFSVFHPLMRFISTLAEDGEFSLAIVKGRFTWMEVAGICQQLHIAGDRSPILSNTMFFLRQRPNLIGGERVLLVGILQEQLVHVQDRRRVSLSPTFSEISSRTASVFFFSGSASNHRCDSFSRQSGSGFIRMLTIFPAYKSFFSACHS